MLLSNVQLCFDGLDYTRTHTHTQNSMMKCVGAFLLCYLNHKENEFLCFYSFTVGDLEKEKRRLQNIMSTGQEEPTAAPPKNVPGCHDHGVEEERDQFQEGGAHSTESGSIQLIML